VGAAVGVLAVLWLSSSRQVYDTSAPLAPDGLAVARLVSENPAFSDRFRSARRAKRRRRISGCIHLRDLVVFIQV
jgi:hypothetical protein